MTWRVGPVGVDGSLRLRARESETVTVKCAMDVEYTFKKHFLSADQKLWLAQVTRTPKPFSPREARLALRGLLSANFSPDDIDPRLYAHRRLTPVGLWHVSSHHPQLVVIDKSISAIRERMLRDPRLKSISAVEIAADTGMSEQEVGEALYGSLPGSADVHGCSWGPLSGNVGHPQPRRFRRRLRVRVRT